MHTARIPVPWGSDLDWAHEPVNAAQQFLVLFPSKLPRITPTGDFMPNRPKADRIFSSLEDGYTVAPHKLISHFAYSWAKYTLLRLLGDMDNKTV